MAIIMRLLDLLEKGSYMLSISAVISPRCQVERLKIPVVRLMTPISTEETAQFRSSAL